MKQSRLARLLHEKLPAVGGWINMVDPLVPVIFANAGYDWLLIDMEHHPFTETQVQSMFHAVRHMDVTPVVRVRGNDPGFIKWVLDAGAGGIVVPMIENYAEAVKAVDAVKYPPMGSRGFSPLRVTDNWATLQEYRARANEEVLAVCQIEREGAVRDIEKIVELPGCDAVWIGPGDLSNSMGFPGDPNHPRVQETIEHVIQIATQADKPWGKPVRTIEDFSACVRQGALLMVLGSDTFFLSSQADALCRDGMDLLATDKLRNDSTRPG